jgi:hypothetical protein
VAKEVPVLRFIAEYPAEEEAGPFGLNLTAVAGGQMISLKDEAQG